MDDGQTTSHYLAERLKSQAEEQQRKKQAEIELQRLQKNRDAFISDHAPRKYENLVRLLKERVERIRSGTGKLPEIVVTGSCIQLGHVAMYHAFDRHAANPPTNELALSLGVAPHQLLSFLIHL